jgi:hypothetical protein
MLFASKNAFDFTMMSRRDDLIGLCYVLIYLLDENQLGFINCIHNLTKKQKFKFIKNFKLSQTPEDLCGTKEKNPDTYRLLEFVREVFSIGF